jgi:c-di-GMP phosphodiesterase
MDIFVTRQPIFDRDGRLAAYELLYPSAAMLQADPHVDPGAARMTGRVLVDAFVGMGMDNVTGGRPAFVNVSREMLVEGLLELLDPVMLRVELLETVEPTRDVVEACERLVGGGYTLVLDDFVYRPELEPLLKLASIVKLEVNDRAPDEVAAAAHQLRGRGVQLLAEKVETTESRDFCMALGFDLFQGYYYARPELLSQRDLTVQQVQLIRLMNMLRDLDTREQTIEETFRSDVALSYKLLRIVNSAAVGGQGITSIRHAVRLLGWEALYRWVALLLISSQTLNGDVNLELVQSALLRARLCELVGKVSGRTADSGPLFLVGLFSMMEPLLRVPIEAILGQLDLMPAVGQALLQREGPLAPTLALAELYEAGQWNDVARWADEAGVPAERLPGLYLQALAWARTRLPLASG